MASTITAFLPTFVIRCVVDATGTVSQALTRGCKVVEAVVIPTGDAAGGTLQISRSTDGSTYNTVSNAMACATTSTVARPSTLTAAQVDFAAGDYVRCVAASSAVGICNVIVTPIAISGN